MKYIVNTLDDACSDIANHDHLTDDQKERLIDKINDVQNELEDIAFGDEDE